MKAKDLIMRGSQLQNERKALTTLWQEIAENFYPQRADFTLTRYIGEETTMPRLPMEAVLR